MSERSIRLLEALSEIDEQKIDEAAPEERASRFRWRKWGAIAAVLALVVGAGSYLLPRIGGSASNRSPGSAGAGGAGVNEASTFMSYAGPVFPLTLREEDDGVSAEREITLDFTRWMIPGEDGYSGRHAAEIVVTDAYTLSNASGEEKTVSVLYPFSAALYRLAKRMPTLTADGVALDTMLHAGGYSGGFQGVDGGAGEHLLNLDQVNSWEGYKALLSDGRYQAAALGGYPDLSGVPVTVYRFYDYYGPEPDEMAGRPNPSIRAAFELDYDRTTVLSYGFHAASYDRENGTMIQGFSIPEPFNPWHGDPYYLIVIGDDVRNLTTGAYVTGGTDEDTKRLEGAGVSVERYVSDLETALRAAAELLYGRNERIRFGELTFQEIGADFELYFGLLKEFVSSYGVLSREPVARYGTGWLEELDVINVDRVFYLEAEVIIPAGGSVRLAAEMVKDGSYDFYCAHTENRGVYGYDMVTELGSNLNCTEQTAVLKEQGQLEIVRQNFGFDLDGGVDRVTLDPRQEHYYLEVRYRGVEAES